jgi:hypothetical protein
MDNYPAIPNRTTPSYTPFSRHISLLCAGSFFAACCLFPQLLSAAPTLLHQAYQTPQTSQTTVKISFPGPQIAGDLNVIVVGWNDSSAHVSSVADANLNPYSLAVGPTVRTGSLSQSIYYAKNVAAGGNSVTVTFSAAAQYPDIRILEYSGIDPVNAFDTGIGASGSSSTSSSGALTTKNASDLLVAANIVSTSTRSAGAGFTPS